MVKTMSEIDDIKRRAGINEVAAWDTPEFNKNKFDPEFLTNMWLDKQNHGEMMTYMGIMGIENKHLMIEMIAKIALGLKARGGDQVMMDFLTKSSDLKNRT